MKKYLEKGINLDDQGYRMTPILLALPAWVFDYLLTILIYRGYGISQNPPISFFLVIPAAIVTTNFLFFNFNLHEIGRIPKKIWTNCFLLMHVVNGAVAYHFLHGSINGFICFMLIVQAFVILNSSVGLFSTVSAAATALMLGPGIYYLKTGELQFDDLFFIAAGMISALFVGLINRNTLTLLETLQMLYRQSRIAQKNVREKKEQLEELSAKLAKYLSPQVFDSIFSGEREVQIETYRKMISVFFSDIKGFTEMTDRMDAEVMTSILNNYLNDMAEIALRYRGTIDKFIGDAIMIFFGDPETRGVKDDAVSCVLMAIEMRKHMRSLRENWDKIGLSVPLQIRIGINTGFCTVGNFGSQDRLDYTIIGGNVNVASRLESMAGPDQILISQETYMLIKHIIACRKKDEIKVKGVAYPIQTYEAIDRYDNLAAQPAPINEKGRGYSISLDSSKIEKVEKTRVLSLLKQAVDMVNRNGPF